MTLYRLFEVNDKYIEIIGLYQERDIAQKTISIFHKKPYACTYGIDAIDVHSMGLFNRVMNQSEYILSTAKPNRQI